MDPTRVKKSVAMEKGLAQLLGQKPAMEVGGLSRNGEKRMKRKDVGTFVFILKRLLNGEDITKFHGFGWLDCRYLKKKRQLMKP